MIRCDELPGCFVQGKRNDQAVLSDTSRTGAPHRLKQIGETCETWRKLQVRVTRIAPGCKPNGSDTDRTSEPLRFDEYHLLTQRNVGLRRFQLRCQVLAYCIDC